MATVLAAAPVTDPLELQALQIMLGSPVWSRHRKLARHLVQVAKGINRQRDELSDAKPAGTGMGDAYGGRRCVNAPLIRRRMAGFSF